MGAGIMNKPRDGEQAMVNLTLRVPVWVKTWIVEQARQARRTTSDYVRIRLEDMVKAEKGE